MLIQNIDQAIAAAPQQKQATDHGERHDVRLAIGTAKKTRGLSAPAGVVRRWTDGFSHDGAGSGIVGEHVRNRG